MALADDGLRNDALRDALKEALSGRSAHLEDLLCRLGLVLAAHPNLKLAAAFGAELADLGSPAVMRLLAALAGNDAAPDTTQAFLPIAAAHGYAARIRAGRDVFPAWEALGALCADERAPVRIGARDALLTLVVREGGGETLIEKAQAWLLSDDREFQSGTAALAVDVMAEGVALAALHDHGALMDFLSASLALVGNAPRSASRSEGLRRLAQALPRPLAAVAALPGGGVAWLERECTLTISPVARDVLTESVVLLARGRHGVPGSVLTALRAALAISAKPLRDPSRLRPGTGRGKATRR